MKPRIVLFLLALGFGIFVFNPNVPRNRVLGSIPIQGPPVGCSSFDTWFGQCDGEDPNCGSGEYRFSHPSGSGTQGVVIQDVPCENTTCPAVPNQPRAQSNPQCCDQDNDGYNNSSCGGNDCNDGNASINPGMSENCSNGVDDDCDGNVDSQDSECDCPVTCTSAPIESGCYYDSNPCLYPNNDGCPPGMFRWGNCCCVSCPIIIDAHGNGYSLTDAAGGVDFDHNNDGNRERISWTALNSDDAFLVLDRNGNGIVDSGRELFGNTTPQPVTSEPNGFIALAVYDKTTNGGNNDGKINSRDAIYSSLRLWQDRNHNGISEPHEIYTLMSLGIASMELEYKESRRRDEYGNWFHYRAKVRDVRGAQAGRWAWDVFLLRSQ